MSRYDEEVRVHISSGSESILPSETRRGRDALAPCVAPGVNSYTRRVMEWQTKALQAGGALPEDSVFRHALVSHLWFQASGCPTFTGWFFGKPLHTISRFRHQDAQPPPSPRVEEEGRGDEGETRP